MSLDNIQLPHFVIYNLFKKSLVDFSGKEGLAKNPNNKELNFFGGNKQQILLLVNNAETKYVTEPQLSFLSGILKACKLTLGDIGIFNISAFPGISYKDISVNIESRIVLMFGVTPAEIHLPFVMPLYQKQSFNSQIYLSIPTLDELENSTELKKNLWVVLRQIFSL